MPSSIPQHDVQRALATLGVTSQDFDTIRRVPFSQAQTLLQELKVKARRNYKRLALELHPDRTQGDQIKAELFVLLGRVLEELDKTVVHPQPPMPQPISFNYSFNTAPTWVSTATTSRTTTTTTFTAQQVIRIVKMRPR